MAYLGQNNCLVAVVFSLVVPFIFFNLAFKKFYLYKMNKYMYFIYKDLRA